MSSNPENRNKTRFAHESKVTLESTEIGFRRDARMFNFSDFGIYFESDYRLQPGAEIFVGISDSPFAPVPDKYERYRAIVKWRKKLKRSSYYYGYGVEIVEESPKSAEPHPYDGTREHPRKDAAIRVTYEFDNEKYDGVTENVSSSGAFIRSDFPLSLSTDQIVKLWIPLKKKGRIARLTGQVTRTNLRGFGVKFIKSKK
jgi:hypothetical protein